MTAILDYVLLVGFVFSFSSAVFLTLKGIRLI